MDEAALRAMLPMGFGKAKGRGGANAVSTLASAAVPAQPAQPPPRPVQGPSRPVASRQDSDSDDDGLTAEERAANRAAEEAQDDDVDDSDADSDSSADLGPEPVQPTSASSSQFPLTSTATLTSHTKPLSALSLDPSGARIATGSYDYSINLWDFGGMTSTFKPFKTHPEPFGNYWIHDVSWSPEGQHLIAVSGTAQAKLYDRDGNLLFTYKKGDVYLRDMKQTSGHVAEITSCSWIDEGRFVTTSADSTIRYWDVEEPTKQRTVINVKSKERGARTKVTAHSLNHDGRQLAAGCADGALHLWSTSGSYSSPNASVQGAHKSGTDITSVVFSRDGSKLASRGTDHTLKLWDVRSFKKPLAERTDLQNNYSQTNVIFSPDGNSLLTGCSSSSTTGPASIHLLSPLNLHTTHEIPTTSSVIRLAWHGRINQLLYTTSSGSSVVHYSPTHSIRGALLCINKHSTRKQHPDDFEFIPGETPILTPGEDTRGTGTSQASKRRRMAKERQDQSKTQIPQRPIDGPGRGGRIGSAATKHVVQDIHKDHLGNKVDAREALLKYADVADKDPMFTKAWRKEG